MSPVPPRARRSRHSLRLWTLEQAREAIPYIASILRSLREHSLEMQALRHHVENLDNKPGRPDRATLISIQDGRKELGRLQEEFDSALEELTGLDVQLLDPVQGTALIPFAHDDQLAWYIFDLFDSQGIRSWRYQSDPDDARRKLTAAMR